MYNFSASSALDFDYVKHQFPKVVFVQYHKSSLGAGGGGEPRLTQQVGVPLTFSLP